MTEFSEILSFVGTVQQVSSGHEYNERIIVNRFAMTTAKELTSSFYFLSTFIYSSIRDKRRNERVVEIESSNMKTPSHRYEKIIELPSSVES